MAGYLFNLDQQRLINSQGTGYGGSIYFYYTGTSTLAPIYTDIGLTTPLSNPVVVAAGALVPTIYLDNGITYRRRIIYSNGESQDKDPYTFNASSNYPYKSVKDYGAVGDGTTSDQTALVAALAAGENLFWPDGTYVSTANIPGFHSVKHFGPGVVKRGSDLFYPEIKVEQSNTFYTSATGLTTNDGLSASYPCAFQKALDNLANYGPVLDGQWYVSGAAGTYGTVIYPLGLQSKIPVTIKGPARGYPNVPTMIVDGGGGGTACFQALRDNSLYLIDIKFQNSTASGFAMIKGFLATENIHTDYCTLGLDLQTVKSFVGSGIFSVRTSNDIGIKELFNCSRAIGFTYNIVTGKFPNCTGITFQNLSGSSYTGKGILSQENCTGHVEMSTFTDLFRGIEINSSSRVHYQNCNFKRCSVGIQAAEGCNVFKSTGNTYNMGTADACLTGLFLESGAVDTTLYSNSLSSYVTDQTTTPTLATLTGSTAETAFNTYTGYLDGVSFATRGKLVARIHGTLTGTAGTKSLRLRIGTALGTASLIDGATFSAGTTGNFVAEVTLDCLSSTVQATSVVATASTETRVGANTRALTLANGTVLNVYVTGQLSVGTDSIAISYIELRRGGT